MPVIPADSFEALLFDLGGVVFEIDFGRIFAAWARRAGCDPAVVATRFSHDVAYQRHERGEIDAARYFASLRATLGIDIPDAAFAEGWNALWGPEIPGMADLLRRLRTLTRLYAFSNSNPTHHADWSARYADTLRLFHRVFVSSELGARKPEAAAFRAIAAAVGVPLEAMVFFDDTAENVAAARALGLRAVHVRSFADVEASLAAVLA
jgi:putative hydrolase of the HAD superfamily